ncbi:hypothetical protein VC83_07449 [Pseudogymnoascus destructans]|uniref:Uncharacterized protein n=2 Tax=Pseudogymnoascus destructans TaxID=655981 RepID=L8G3H0_PSED2|nr:uncharacterized protein VC83_07449 [Pseudogymnoascus destructans]ELR06511.1 hypothetical protein GMDG_02146 [Pseudogymnoascus destructans 20631-21]OAF56169.1 hypothetical protein VC83_07449 [Pseudogymnoascus destructans]
MKAQLQIQQGPVQTVNRSSTTSSRSHIQSTSRIASPTSAHFDHDSISFPQSGNNKPKEKDAFVVNCLGPAVLADFQAQLAGAKALATVVTAKVSTLLKPIAAQLAGKISANIQRGFDAYTGAAGC